ncbi:unnamed protein product [Tuber aestivum]|uniref:Uncharacterized protein n=1 Tax=Tuber aestivum TaxID=59557 RepID=A0A292PLG5_9PEZI|nr:unnamed protein product [Tuber aestivum]
MDCRHYRDQVLDNCRALFNADVRILTYTRAPLGGRDCIASKLNYHAIIVSKDSAGKLGRENALLGPSHALSRQGAVVALLKQTEEMLGDMLQKREEEGGEVMGLRRGGIDTEVRNQETRSIPSSPSSFSDTSTSLAREMETEAKYPHQDPVPTREESVLPRNPRDSEIGIALLGARDSSLGVQVRPGWRGLLASQADAAPPKPSLPQPPLVERNSQSLSTPAPQSLPGPRAIGPVKATCLTPATHHKSLINTPEMGMHRTEDSGSPGALSPFSAGWDFTRMHRVGRSSYQSTGSDTAQYESGTEAGYESEVSQTTFATDPGFITPRSATPTGTERLDSKQKPEQDLSSFNRALLKNEVELAVKTLLHGLAGQVGSPNDFS